MTRVTWDDLREWKPKAPPERLLSDPGLARASDPATSQQAAQHDVGGHRAKVLRAIAGFTTPANRDVIANAAHLSQYEVSKRLPELVRLGLIEVTGTLIGYSGREQQAYSITAAGLRVLRP